MDLIQNQVKIEEDLTSFVKELNKEMVELDYAVL